MNVRQWIRAFLGLDRLPTAEARVIVIGGRISKIERTSSDISSEICKLNAGICQLSGKMDQIHALLITAHAFERPISAPIPTDWEQVSLSQLNELLHTPEKEKRDAY